VKYTDLMSTREALQQRPDIPDEDIDDVIAIAQELQDADRARADHASLAEVEEVAGELDIDPAYVEEALGELMRRRADAAADQEQQDATRRRLLLGGAATVGGTLLLGMLWVATALPGLWSSAADLDRATAQLDVVIDRQASLAPQLVALAGGEAAGLTTAVQAVRDADTVPDRLAAADALGTAMATALAALPPGDDAAQQLRLNLQYEITGTANRIATEQARYEAARVVHEQAHAGLRAGIATSLGLAR